MSVYCNLKINGKICQIYPHKMTLKQCLSSWFQKLYVEQYDYDKYLKFCYAVLIGNPYELDEQQYNYYLHELYDDYPIF